MPPFPDSSLVVHREIGWLLQVSYYNLHLNVHWLDSCHWQGFLQGDDFHEDATTLNTH